MVSDMKDDRNVICSDSKGADCIGSSVVEPILSARDSRDAVLVADFSGTLCGKEDEIQARTSEN